MARQPPRPRARAGKEANLRARQRYREANARERRGTIEQKSERLNRSDEAGEPSRGTQRSERGRRGTAPCEGTMTATSSADRISPKLARIAELARRSPDMVFTTLFHHVDMDWMREAYRRTRKDGAVGVDGQAAAAFADDLEGNLRRLLDAARSGTYRAPPVRRVHIPKGDGSQTRPIGIPTYADKVLQRAVAMLLEPIYEEDFYDFSYGYRPELSAHDALAALRKQIESMRSGAWVL